MLDMEQDCNLESFFYYEKLKRWKLVWIRACF